MRVVKVSFSKRLVEREISLKDLSVIRFELDNGREIDIAFINSGKALRIRDRTLSRPLQIEPEAANAVVIS